MENAAPVVETKTITKQNGIKRPDAGTLTGSLWDIADRLSNEKNAPATRKEVVDTYLAEVPNSNVATANTQYARWVTYHGVADRIAESRKAESLAKKEEAKKAREEAKAKKAAEREAAKSAEAEARAAKEAEKAEKERIAAEQKAAKAAEREAAKKAKEEAKAAEKAAKLAGNTGQTASA